MRDRSCSASALQRVLLFTTLAVLFSSLSVAAAEKRRFDIAAGEAARALNEFSRQSELQIYFDADVVRRFMTNAVAGEFEAAIALSKMLGGTGLGFEFVNERTIAIMPAGKSVRGIGAGEQKPVGVEQGNQTRGTEVAANTRGTTVRSYEADSQRSNRDADAGIALAEVVVTGTHLRRRLGDSVLPVTSFGREDIERTGATSVADVLDYIPQQSFSIDERLSLGGGARRVQLRGLGPGTTLVLVNGQRTVTSALQGASNTFNVNTIPLSAVERIEVLTDSASALYGSDAVGGVVNIILKTSIEQPEVALYYGSADGGGEERRASLGGGLTGERYTISAIVEGFEKDPLEGIERERFADQDFRRFGGPDRRVPFANPGTISSGTAANLPGLPSPVAAVPAGSSGVGLTSADFLPTAGQTNMSSLNAHAYVVPEAKRLGGATFGEFRINDHLTLFGTVLYADAESAIQAAPTLLINAVVPATNPFNPFGVPVRANYLFTGVGPRRDETESESLRTVVGLRGPLRSWDWELALLDTREDSSSRQDQNVVDLARANAALAATDPSQALNVFQDGPGGSPSLLASITAPPLVQTFESNAAQAGLVVRGPLLTLPSGAIQAAFGAEAREEELDFPIDATTAIRPDRDTIAAFAEFRIPLTDPSTQRTLLRRLDMSLAGRYDDYSDFGGQLSPQYGLEWMPVSNVTIHAAYGESFRAPSLFELHFPRLTSTRAIADPRRNNILTSTQITTGGNPTLEPEESVTRSFGLVFAPQSAAGIRIAGKYWRITQSDRVGNLTTAVFFQNEALFADRFVRAAPDPTDIAAGRPGQLLSIDTSRINAGRLDTGGVDGNLSASFETRLGTWSPSLSATWVRRYEAAPHPTAPMAERVARASAEGTIPRWRAVGTMSWHRHGLGISVTGRYTSSYDDVNNLGVLTGREVGSQTLVDLQASWGAGESLQRWSWFEGLTIRAGIMNATDESPEFSTLDFAAGYDPSQADTRQRFGYLSVVKRF